MEFGLEKCAEASFKKGKLTSTGNLVIEQKYKSWTRMEYTNTWVWIKVMVSSTAKWKRRYEENIIGEYKIDPNNRAQWKKQNGSYQ